MFRIKNRTLSLVVIAAFPAFAKTTNQIEPRAGTWKTWVISSGKDFRVPAPPDATTTQGEQCKLRAVVVC
jgi:hypothetical protein